MTNPATLGQANAHIQQIPPPPGKSGEIANFIYNSSIRPVPEYAIASMLGFFAGILGRTYNDGNSGLNQYIMMLGPTGSGKSNAKEGGERILAAIAAKTGNSIDETFMGPSDLSSGQALSRHVAQAKPPCFTIDAGEFGHRFALMAKPNAAPHDVSLKKVMTDIFHRSGKHQTLRAVKYAKSDNDIPIVLSPAVSILADSTASTFYDNLTEGVLTDGTVNRFNIVEYTGDLPPFNEEADNARLSYDMLDYIAAMVAKAKSDNDGRLTVTDVGHKSDGDAVLKRFREDADNEYRASETDCQKALHARSHIKAMRLAALLAVIDDFENPEIGADHAMWAINFVKGNTLKLLSHVGYAMTSDDAKMEAELMNFALRYGTEPYERFKSYGATEELHLNNVISHTCLSRKASGLSIFKNSRLGKSAALERTIKSLLEQGLLKRVSNISSFEEDGKLIHAPKFFTDAKLYKLAAESRDIDERNKLNKFRVFN